jgi:hypothetical protein
VKQPRERHRRWAETVRLRTRSIKGGRGVTISVRLVTIAHRCVVVGQNRRMYDDAQALDALREYLAAHEALGDAVRPFVEDGLLLTDDRRLELHHAFERRDAAFAAHMKQVLGPDPRL